MFSYKKIFCKIIAWNCDRMGLDYLIGWTIVKINTRSNLAEVEQLPWSSLVTLK